MNKFLLGLMCVSALWISGCNRNATVAEVGSEKIVKNDVDLKVKAMATFSVKIDDKMALEQLINDYALTEVIKRTNDPKLESLVDEELKKIDQSKLNNSQLAKVRGVFGGDTQSFKKIYLRPLVASRLAFTEGYMKDEDFQKTRKQQAETFLAEALKKPAVFEELAKKSGLHFQKGKINSTQGLVWNSSADTSILPSGPRIAENWRKAGLNTTATGQIVSKLIEEDRSWVVLKNLGASSNEKGATEVAVVNIPKEPYRAWIEKQKESISIKRMATN
jgi:hypothetical protein